MQNLTQTILNHWFKGMDKNGNVPKEQSATWWKKDPDYDSWLREHFSQDLNKAINGELDHLLSKPEGRLALIILVDQFSRQIHRGTPESFTHDAIACKWALEGIELKHDQLLFPIQRVFFYMPLEHAEDLLLQEKVILLNQNLLNEVSETHRSEFQTYVDFAIAHRDIIARFGRFPHRNIILNRKTTREETEFLSQPNSSF